MKISNFKGISLSNTTICYAPKYDYHKKFDQIDKWVNVNDKFNLVIKIILIASIIDIFHCLVRMTNALASSASVKRLYYLFYLNYILGLVSAVMLIVTRFSEFGRVCSGEFISKYDQYPFNGEYLNRQAIFLEGLMIYILIGPLVLSVVLFLLVFLKS